MSTRSIIGTTTKNTFHGLYCNFDGYPSSMVPALAKIITRDGAPALDVLTGKTAIAPNGPAKCWDSITAEMPAADTALPYPTSREYWDAVPVGQRDPGLMDLYGHLGYGDTPERRGEIAAGYGTVDSKRSVVFSGNLNAPPETGGTEWMYLFTEDLTLIVFDILRHGLVETGRFTLAELKAMAGGAAATDPRLLVAECGENFTRCSHMAWFHDETVPDESRSLGMAEWLGTSPVAPEKAVAVIVDGERLELRGGGHSGQGKWWMTVKGSGASMAVLRMGQNGRRGVPLPGVELVLPATKASLAV